MRLSETIIIYLAAGAPFGVACYLGEQPCRSRTLALLKSTGAMLLWPLRMAAILHAAQRHKREAAAAANENEIDAPASEKLEQARREMVSTLDRVYKLAREESAGRGSEILERTAYVARESVEKYIGLRMAAAVLAKSAAPGRREMETCRIAGRKGDDLVLAGLCVHRRNVARLNSHLDRARAELVHTLAELREIAEGIPFTSHTNAKAARRLSEMILNSYGHAIEMFSLLDDRRAAMSVARLLDAECARLRRLEALAQETARATGFGEEPCTPTHIHQLAFNNPPQGLSLKQG